MFSASLTDKKGYAYNGLKLPVTEAERYFEMFSRDKLGQIHDTIGLYHCIRSANHLTQKFKGYLKPKLFLIVNRVGNMSDPF